MGAAPVGSASAKPPPPPTAKLPPPPAAKPPAPPAASAKPPEKPKPPEALGSQPPPEEIKYVNAAQVQAAIGRYEQKFRSSVEPRIKQVISQTTGKMKSEGKAVPEGFIGKWSITYRVGDDGKPTDVKVNVEGYEGVKPAIENTIRGVLEQMKSDPSYKALTDSLPKHLSDKERTRTIGSNA